MKARFGKLGTFLSGILRPIEAFFRLEAAGGIALLVSAIVAMVWVNVSPSTYDGLFHAPLTLDARTFVVSTTVLHAINDGLMTIFFFVVGMEIKRELALGELSNFKSALLPGVAALGGMVVPAAVYLFFTGGTPAQPGWGIPMATDIAFSIGCLTLLRSRVSHSLVVFLTALAIFDDIGGILVIAIFYGTGIQLPWLAGAFVITVAIWLIGRANLSNGWFYLIPGVALWFAVHHAGIHATIAGVIVGLLIPPRPAKRTSVVLGEIRKLAESDASNKDEGQVLAPMEDALEDAQAPLDRFVHMFHPYVAFLIVPLFALGNAGIDLSGMELGALASPVALGTGLGLLIGKPLGITLASWIAVKIGAASLPSGATWAKVFGVSVIAGIGFTVALFIAALAFPGDASLLAGAKLGITLGSALAGVLGCVWLLGTSRVGR